MFKIFFMRKIFQRKMQKRMWTMHGLLKCFMVQSKGLLAKIYCKHIMFSASKWWQHKSFRIVKTEDGIKQRTNEKTYILLSLLYESLKFWFFLIIRYEGLSFMFLQRPKNALLKFVFLILLKFIFFSLELVTF